MRQLHKIFLWLNIVWVVLTCLSLLAPYVNPQGIWQFSFFGMAFPMFLVGNILFLILWSFLRKRYFILSLVCLLLGFNAFRGFFGLHTASSNDTDGNNLSVLTYNLQHLAGMKLNKGAPQKYYNYQKIKEVLLDQKADILGLQEISAKELERINDSLAYPYNFSTPTHSTQILSKYPIMNGGGEGFKKSGNSYLWADIKMPQGTFRLINIHLQSNRVSAQTDRVFSNASGSWSSIQRILSNVKNRTHQRVDQAKALQEFMDQSPYPIILCGDFNEAPQSYIYKMLTKKLTDSFKKAGWGLGTTYAGKIPGLRIDYIMADAKFFEVIKTEVPQLEFSDHYPVKSMLRWK